MKRLLIGVLASWILAGSAFAQFFGGGTGGSSGGAGDVSSVSVSTATNPSAETQLKELTLTAGALNSANKTVVFQAAGRYTTAAAQTPTMRFRTYLCTVSGCGSGTVVTLADFTTAATTASTTNSWKIEGSIGTASTGATGTVESKFWLQTQLGSAGDLTPETRLDQNNAASAAIDLTGVLYVRTTVLMSTANAGNSVTARMARVGGGGNTGGGSGLTSAELDTCAEFAAIMSGETGTCGSVVLSQAPTVDSPTFTTKLNAPSVTAFPGGPSAGDIVIVTDDSAVGACDSAAGTAVTICRYTGAAWAAIGDGNSGGGTTVTATSTFGTDNRVLRSDGTGRGSQASGVTLDDTDNFSGAGSYAAGTTPATAGLYRSPNNTQGPCWRNAANSANFCIKLNASNEYEFDAPINTTGTAGPWTIPEIAAPGAPSGAGNHYFYIDSTTNRLATHENAGSAKDYVTAADTQTLTNKTLDAEGTGNVLTIPRRIWLPAAGCNNATAAAIWDTMPTTGAAAACITGTNTQKGVLDFADGATVFQAQTTWKLPSTWTGTVDANIKWLSATTTGDVVWQLATICVADAETDDPAFNTASTVTDTAKGTTNQTNDAAITGVTVTGCAAGELMHVKIFRDPAHASDTHAATARLIGVELVIREAI